MPGVKDLVADPEFHKLPVSQQREALSRFDPEFNKLSDWQIGEFKLKFPKPIDYANVDPGPQLKSDSTTGRLGREFVHALPTILGSLGGVAGSVPGAAAGYGIGSLIDNFPRLMNKDTAQSATGDILADTAIGAGTEAITPLISKGLSRGKDYLLDKLVRSFPIHPQVEDVAPLGASGLNFSVGQATQSPTAKFLERNLASETKLAGFRADQASDLADISKGIKAKFASPRMTSGSPYEDIGQEAQVIVKHNYDASKANVDTLYNKVKFDAEANRLNFKVKTGETPSSVVDASGKQTMIPQFENVEVKGPILYPETLKFIDKVKPEIDKIYDTLPAGTPERAKFDRFKRLLDQLEIGMTDPSGKQVPLAEWNTIKEFRTEVNQAMNSKVFGELSRGEGGLAQLSKLLGKDVESSVANIWEQRTPGALNRLTSANDAFAEHADRFNSRVRNAVYGSRKSPADPSAVFKVAEDSPEAANEMIRALGPQEQRPIKAHFYERLMDTAGDKPDKALDLLDSPIYNKIFSQSDKKDMVDFFRTMRRIDPDSSQAGNFSLTIRKAGIALSLGAGAIDYFTGAHGISLPTAIGATVMIASKPFAEKVLLNPRFARSAARLAKLAPDSDEATFLRKTILTSLRGVDLTIRMNNGDEKAAKVNANGKIIPQ